MSPSSWCLMVLTAPQVSQCRRSKKKPPPFRIPNRPPHPLQMWPVALPTIVSPAGSESLAGPGELARRVASLGLLAAVKGMAAQLPVGACGRDTVPTQAADSGVPLALDWSHPRSTVPSARPTARPIFSSHECFAQRSQD